ncbi:MAG: hemerythrin domain-containing protein [Muribaculaceae bacterium]|nr:hemerythrin domain-containing protein [Muribaculaceae bacterium]
MAHIFFEKQGKLSDMITLYPNLLHTLPRFDISLGFGNKTIAEVCEQNGVNPDFFLLICNVYSFDDYLPSKQELATIDMSQLVTYLEKSHRYYLDKRISHIQHHMNRIVGLLQNKRIGEVLHNFIEVYRGEVEEHFNYEEQNVYAHLTKLQQGIPDKAYSIADFISSHGNLQEKLEDLTQIIFKYLPAQMSAEDDAIEVVFDLLQLSRDLKKHSLIEEKIMVPYVMQLERRVK